LSTTPAYRGHRYLSSRWPARTTSFAPGQQASRARRDHVRHNHQPPPRLATNARRREEVPGQQPGRPKTCRRLRSLYFGSLYRCSTTRTPPSWPLRACSGCF